MFDFEVDVKKGHWVNYYAHPGAGISYPAVVIAKGDDSIECIVYAWNGQVASASHKSGVRHVTNPLFNDPVILANVMADGDSGCFELHADQVLIKQLCARIEELESRVYKGKVAKPKLETKDAPPPDVKPDLSFRLDEGPELTEEQKAERRELLKSAV